MHIDPEQILKAATEAGWLEGETASGDAQAILFSGDNRQHVFNHRFDPAAYTAAYGDAADYPLHPLLHYLIHGQAEGRRAFAHLPPAPCALPDGAMPLWVCSNDFSLTGAPLAATTLYQGLFARFGMRPGFACSPHDGAVAEAWAHIGTQTLCHGLSHLRTQSAADIAFLITSYHDLMRDSGVACVHVHSAVCFPAVLAAKRLGLPVIWTLHEPGPDETLPWDHSSGYLVMALAGTLMGADRIVFVSDSSAAAWQAPFAIPDAKISLIPKAIPLTPRSRAQARKTIGLRTGDILVLCVGTVCARKGQSDIIEMLETWPTAPQDGLHFTFVGFNDTPYASDLRGRGQALMEAGWSLHLLNESTTWADRRHVDHLFAAADVVLVPSRAESRPLVISEAFAHGGPVICTQGTGMDDMVLDDETGYFYPPGDIATLTEAFQKLINAPNTRTRLRRSIAKAHRADGFDRMLDAYIDLLAVTCPQLLAQDRPHFHPLG